MKHLILLTLLSILSSAAAQVETATWNGKTYYVYPHQLEARSNDFLFLQYADYREVPQRDEKNRKIVRTEIEPVDREALNPYGMMKKQSGREKKELDRALKEVLQKKPELFYRFDTEYEQDITPALEPIPDGEYVQFYRDMPYLDNNILRYKNDIVAAVFTIRNGVPDGQATWFGLQNAVLKSGRFANGARTGEWTLSRYEPNREQFPAGKANDDLFILDYILTHDLVMDTMTEIYQYSAGLRNGPYSRVVNGRVYETGSFRNDEETGTWSTYVKRAVFDDADSIWIETDSLILRQRFSYPDSKVRGKGVIIRSDVVAEEFLRNSYYDMPYYDEENGPGNEGDTLRLEEPYYFGYDNAFESFGELYSILSGQDEDEGLELPEEALHSYEGEEYDPESYPYNEAGEYFSGDYGYGAGQEHYFLNGKSYTRQELIDSLGYQFRYEGVFEEYFANGQLRCRFEIRNGQLVSEDTVFWSNGNPANTVWFDEATREYVQHFFDYDGKLYKTLVFDEQGKPLTEEETEDNSLVIDGLPYEFGGEWGEVLEYVDRDGMYEGLSDRALILATRWSEDSALASVTYFDPATATREHVTFNVLGDTIYTEQAVFGDDYENVSVTASRRFGPLRLETVSSGSKSEHNFDWRIDPSENDSASPMFDALYYYGGYNLTSDEVLYYGDKPFSGKLQWSHGGSALRISAKESSIGVKLPSDEKAGQRAEKDLRRFRKTGKRSPLLRWYTPDFVYSNVTGAVLELFPFAYSFYTPNHAYYRYEEEYYYPDEYGDQGKKKKKKERKSTEPHDKTMTGSFLNGKPHGEWTVRDQFGQLTARVNFTGGELQGEATFYATEFPLTESETQRRNEYIEQYHVFIFDAPPVKKTQYISEKRHYRNGMLNGPSVRFNWRGDTVAYDYYRDGFRHGPSFERNKLFYSAATFENGALDGISQTYLTVPGGDSVLIFDLNFQGGVLQGASTTYHTNGKPAKRGFFYLGQPIDDYEAFDTLGFRYQYVKFQYNQPVEEKIWEENQLSVRYLFDWKDSIPFDISDIQGSSSFERLVYDLGLIRDPYSQPYYGRPSLVDKTGIDYEITKYYPNDTIAREGRISKGKKVGHWNYYDYNGKALYEVDYADTVLVVNDSIRYKSKGVLTYFDDAHRPTSKSYIIEKIEKYDCSHSDHNEERMLYAFWERDSTVGRINGYVKNYYDNGAIMNEGRVVNGIPTGVWKLYDSDGQLNQVGTYVMGKRDGRWLKGDLGNVKNMSEICLNPNLDNLEEIMAYQEKLLDVSVIYYHLGSVVKRQYYGINMNNGEAPEGYDEGY